MKKVTTCLAVLAMSLGSASVLAAGGNGKQPPVDMALTSGIVIIPAEYQTECNPICLPDDPTPNPGGGSGGIDPN